MLRNHSLAPFLAPAAFQTAAVMIAAAKAVVKRTGDTRNVKEHSFCAVQTRAVDVEFFYNAVCEIWKNVIRHKQTPARRFLLGE